MRDLNAGPNGIIHREDIQPLETYDLHGHVIIATLKYDQCGVHHHQSDDLLFGVWLVVPDVGGFLFGLFLLEEGAALAVLPHVVVEAPVVALVEFGVVLDPLAELLEGEAGWCCRYLPVVRSRQNFS